MKRTAAAFTPFVVKFNSSKSNPENGTRWKALCYLHSYKLKAHRTFKLINYFTDQIIYNTFLSLFYHKIAIVVSVLCWWHGFSTNDCNMLALNTQLTFTNSWALTEKPSPFHTISYESSISFSFARPTVRPTDRPSADAHQPTRNDIIFSNNLGH